jgi:predicted ATPase with chaperone activity
VDTGGANRGGVGTAGEASEPTDLSNVTPPEIERSRQMGLSARAYHRVLMLARTIADLAGEERIATAYVAEALQYRPRVAE